MNETKWDNPKKKTKLYWLRIETFTIKIRLQARSNDPIASSTFNFSTNKIHYELNNEQDEYVDVELLKKSDGLI